MEPEAARSFAVNARTWELSERVIALEDLIRSFDPNSKLHGATFESNDSNGNGIHPIPLQRIE